MMIHLRSLTFGVLTAAIVFGGTPDADAKRKPKADEAQAVAPIDLAALEEAIAAGLRQSAVERSEEHTSELQSLMRISYAVFCLKKQKYDNAENNLKIKHKKV